MGKLLGTCFNRRSPGAHRTSIRLARTREASSIEWMNMGSSIWGNPGLRSDRHAQKSVARNLGLARLLIKRPSSQVPSSTITGCPHCGRGALRAPAHGATMRFGDMIANTFACCFWRLLCGAFSSPAQRPHGQSTPRRWLCFPQQPHSQPHRSAKPAQMPASPTNSRSGSRRRGRR